jgi:hypothetical protein
MHHSTLQACLKRCLQRGESFSRQLNLIKKFKKFFCLALAICFTASPCYSADFSLTDLPDAGSEELFVLQIPDLHDSYEIQKRISALIRVLVKEHGFHLILEEGNDGNIPVSSVFWTGAGKLRTEWAESFLREGKITGAEFARAAGSERFALLGVETPALYRRHLRLKREILTDQRDAVNRLTAVENNLRREGRLIFSPNLLRYLRVSENFWKGKGAPPFEIPSFDLGQIVAEDAKQKDRLLENPRQRELLVRLEAISAFLRACRLEASRNDLRFLADRPAVMKEFLKEDPFLNRFWKRVREYYEVARARDRALAGNTLRTLERLGAKRAILVAGGFHTDGISRIFREAGIRQAVVSPLPGPGAATLREPNLLNMPVREARLFADLRGLGLLKKTSAHYQMLKTDARRLLAPEPGADPLDGTGWATPPDVRKDAAVLLPLGFSPSVSLLDRLARWSQALLKSNQVDLVIAVRTRSEQRRVHAMLNDALSKDLRSRVRVIRILTAHDFGALRRYLHGRFVFLFARESDKRRLESRGIAADQFFAARWSAREGSDSPLLRELAQLQNVYRTVVTSA